MIATAASLEDLTFSITQETHVRASLDATFAALLEQAGPLMETHDGKPLPLRIEPWPGGRWYRDLGGDNGHFWAHVQAIKRPTLLELSGPLFMSSAVISNLQYRLTEVEGGTLITFRHTAFGFLPQDLRQGMPQGWNHLLSRIRRQAESHRPVA